MSWKAIDLALERLGSERANLIALMQAVQESCHVLSAEARACLAERTGICEAELTGVQFFFSGTHPQFRVSSF